MDTLWRNNTCHHLFLCPSPFEKEGVHVYCFAPVDQSVHLVSKKSFGSVTNLGTVVAPKD